MTEHYDDQWQQAEAAQRRMETLIDVFCTDEPVIDKWTIVTNETNPYNHGYHTMLATDNTGWGFSQWTEGRYTPDGDNSHLGNQVCLIGGTLLNHVLRRLEPME